MLSREKNKITFLHFILSILVILIHSINNTSVFQKIFSIESGIGQFAVPLFFMLSGFLFFNNINSFDKVTRKIKNRIITVFYPFMIWNFIYYIVHHILKPGEVFSIIELVDSIFTYTYNPAFWFMFQLILLIAITPIIYYAINKTSYFVIFFILVSILIITNFDIPFINEDAIIYFSTGSFFAKLYNDDKVAIIEKKSIIYAFFISLFCFFINRIAFEFVNMDIKFVHVFTLTIVYVRLAVAFFIFYIVDIIFKYNKVPFFMYHSFFLYAIHYMIVKGLIVFMNYVKYKFLEPEIWFTVETCVFIASPVICIIISQLVSKLMMKKLPKVYALITGNR